MICRRHVIAVATAALVGVLTGACGGSGTTATEQTSTATTAAHSATEQRVEGHAAVVVKDPSTPVEVRQGPAGDAKVINDALPGRTRFGTPLTMLVLDRTDAWFYVALPGRPNGSTGWVEAERFELRRLVDEIVVRLARRTIELSVGGKDYVGRIAVGAPDTPTPLTKDGVPAYVTDTVSKNPRGPYGPTALGLSLHSDVLTTFGDSGGQVAIHGTNEPQSIGKAASHGCIRVEEDLAGLLVRIAAGTPVTILP